MKSKYRVSAPMIVFLAITSLPSASKYIDFIFCVSYAVSPTKTSTPSTEITKWRADDAMKIFTMLAIMMPIRPIIKNDPMPERSFFVVYPYKLIPAKVPAVMKNTRVMDVPV